MNEKKMWVEFFLDSRRMIAGRNDSLERSITFVTNIGYIVAEESEVKGLDVKIDGDTHAQLVKAFEEKGAEGIDLFTLSTTMMNLMKEKKKFTDDKDKVVFLQNAKIIQHNNLGTEMDVRDLALFIDQIIAVIPGSMSAKS